ncbi:hypothetical protein PXK30_09780 [Phaeobacter gallaeciensis]|uniref:hypothetical protein n=1 Tax=Phaeobacter gallaeciensis TaxID=60890 RepID=UPI00237EFAA4|nr:hypothetical protein [Phaeobacter gallaeciensis]MDE4303587.1 hypothetical protein [Phaeobacter gallaeciensis]MDE4307931.1 hypothetical protein [Phaeobacter gallaeciensis]MDE4312389.1 hypothetical protein [Phaeobacter gallaeciensis]MDE4316860.1 hypothetical protein [Phaeobacter gallaeciensis]MDE4321323.1 hypothetical protein [Phaeobacter gallaeciensis]
MKDQVETDAPEKEDTGSTDLIILPEKKNLAGFFHGTGGENGDQGILQLIDMIEAPLKGVTHDVSTAKGRKAAKSLARQVSSTKTALEDVRKDITKEWRDQIDKVNAAGKIAVERLDALRDRIKGPAEEAEKQEAERVRQILLRMDAFDTNVLSAHDSSAELKAKIEQIEAIEVDSSFEEHEAEARVQKAAALDKYRSDLGIAEAREAQEAELEQLRREKAERDAKEAEEKAAKEREEQERAEKERREKEQREAAERAAKEAEEKAAREKAEAEERHRQEMEAAKREAEEAAAAERQRIADEERAKAEAEAKRKADADHRAKITAEIVASITELQPAGWEPLIDAMIDGKIPHVKVCL